MHWIFVATSEVDGLYQYGFLQCSLTCLCVQAVVTAMQQIDGITRTEAEIKYTEFNTSLVRVWLSCALALVKTCPSHFCIFCQLLLEQDLLIIEQLVSNTLFLKTRLISRAMLLLQLVFGMQ